MHSDQWSYNFTEESDYEYLAKEVAQRGGRMGKEKKEEMEKEEKAKEEEKKEEEEKAKEEEEEQQLI